MLHVKPQHRSWTSDAARMEEMAHMDRAWEKVYMYVWRGWKIAQLECACERVHLGTKLAWTRSTRATMYTAERRSLVPHRHNL